MTEQQMSVTSTEHDAETPKISPGHPGPRDLSHPSRSEVAEAVAASEQINEADEVYAAVLAGLEESRSSADHETPDFVERVGQLTGEANDDQLAGAVAAESENELVDPVPTGRPDSAADAVEAGGPRVALMEGAVANSDADLVEFPTVEDAAGEDAPANEDALKGDDAREAEDAPEAEPTDGATSQLIESASDTELIEAAVGEPVTEAAADASLESMPEPASESVPPSASESVPPSAVESLPESDLTVYETEMATTAVLDTDAHDTDTDTDTDTELPTEIELAVAPTPAPPVVTGRLGALRPGNPSGPRPTPPGGSRPSPIPRTSPGQPASTAPFVPDSLAHSSDPNPWGRVDEDGTVYVSTQDGERAVGFWQAGDPAAGLAHYGRRYDDFVTEIVVLEARLANQAGDAKATRTHAQMLRQSTDTLPAVGDLATAAARLAAVIEAAERTIADATHGRAKAKAAAVERRGALCAEAEALAESNQWKTSGDRLKEIVDEWRTIKGIDRKTDDLLWKRFSKARDTFIRRRGSHFAELDKERGAARGVKDTLIARAEKLSESTDWADTATEYRTLMAEWKAAGRTSRDVEDSLWDKFRAAQEKFFSRRQETFASRDAEFEANAIAKGALLVEAEKIDPVNGIDAAKASLRSIQDRWEAAGKVPRERIRTLDARLHAVEDRVKSAEDSFWRKTDPEATARLAQFRSRYEAYQAQADKATASGDPKRATAAQAQADQWLEWLRAAENAVE